MQEYQIKVGIEEGMELILTIPSELNANTLKALLTRMNKISKAAGIEDIDAIIKSPATHKKGNFGFDSPEQAEEAYKQFLKGKSVAKMAKEQNINYQTLWRRINVMRKRNKK